MEKTKKIHILIIDDDAELRETLLTGLDQRGYLVDVAESAEDAALKMSPKIKLILLDALLPKMNGFEFCKKIKESKFGQKIPVVIMTGIYKQHFQEKEARLKYGAADYLLKPFTLDRLEEIIQTNLGFYEKGEITSEGLGFKSQGELKTVHVELLLKNIAEKRKTGLLELRRGKMLRRFYFNKGILILGRSNVRGDSISQILFEKGKITEEQRENIDNVSKEKRIPKEKAAVLLGIMGTNKIKPVLEEMLTKMLNNVINWKEGTYILKLREQPPPKSFLVEVDTKKVLIQSILKFVRK